MADKINVRKLPVISLYTNVDGTTQFKYKFGKEKYNGQDDAVKYMKSAVVYGARPEILHDAFSDEIIPYESLVMTDGHFKWSSELLYYVEKYNLILPKEFMDQVEEDKTVKITGEDLVW